MPLHTFVCDQCRHAFERIVPSMASSHAIQCPECQADKVERQLCLPAKPPAVKVATNCSGTGPPCGASYCGRKAT